MFSSVSFVHKINRIFTDNLFPDPIATQVTSAILGPRPSWNFCSANAAMPPVPGSTPQRQPVHSDADFDHPTHPFALVVNVPLITMTPENGSTEIWLGTHKTDMSAQKGKHGERASGRIKEELLSKRSQEEGQPPLQPTIQKGSIVIRDLRLWHAGMPNHTDQVRIMLALIHFAPWYRNKMRLQLGEDVKPILEKLDGENKLGLNVPVDWVSSDQALRAYMNRPFGNHYDFNQDP